MYYDMIRSVITFAQGDKAACAAHMTRITEQLRPLLSSYYDRAHDPVIAHSAWLSHVQGFYAWGAGYHDEAAGRFVMFDGMSGNQILLFQALDAFLGLEPYLPEETRLRNVPAKQRELARVFEKHSFRAQLDVETNGEADADIAKEFDAIIKKLRVIGLPFDCLVRLLADFDARCSGQRTEPGPRLTCLSLHLRDCL